MSSYYYPLDCKKSASRTHDEGSRRDGRCTWCGVKFTSSAPRPITFPVSDLTEAYGLHFDPNYGAWNAMPPLYGEML